MIIYKTKSLNRRKKLVEDTIPLVEERIKEGTYGPLFGLSPGSVFNLDNDLTLLKEMLNNENDILFNQKSPRYHFFSKFVYDTVRNGW